MRQDRARPGDDPPLPPGRAGARPGRPGTGRGHGEGSPALPRIDLGALVLLGAFVAIAALGALAPRYRMPVVLRHLEGFSYDEIAEVLDQPAGTARANVHRGLALLRASKELKGATS